MSKNRTDRLLSRNSVKELFGRISHVKSNRALAGLAAIVRACRDCLFCISVRGLFPRLGLDWICWQYLLGLAKFADYPGYSRSRLHSVYQPANPAECGSEYV